MRFFFFFIVTLRLLTPLYSQEQGSVANNIYQQIRFFPQEKVYLFTDRAAYAAGESIWFRAFLTDAVEHRQDIPLSRYVYVDLIDPNGNVCKHLMIRPDSNHIFHNCIELEEDTAEGTYTIRAYTTYMRARPEYLFEKRVFIANPQSPYISVKPEFSHTDPNPTSFDVSFFPEGGYLIENTITKVGFKALRSDGASEAITGDVFDSNGEHITSFQSIHAGMGSFSFVPEGGKTYYALCTNMDNSTKQFELPQVPDNACAIRVTSRGDQWLISAAGNLLFQDPAPFLIVHIRGMVFYADQMPKNNLVVLQGADLPAGIVQVLLLDHQMNPVSERLLFNKQHDFVIAGLTFDQSNYPKRALVKMVFQLDTPKGYENSGSFAVSVTDNRNIPIDSTMTLSSYLLLSSELRGHIEDANYYLCNTSEATEALDALMLTQGWRRYNIPQAAKGIIEEPNGYIESSQEFSGTVREFFLGRRVQDASVFVMAPDEEYMQEVITDETGKFYASGFEFPDSTRYTILTFAPNGRQVELTLDPALPPLPVTDMAARTTEPSYQFSDFIAKADPGTVEENGIRIYQLSEAIVTARTGDAGRSVFSSDVVTNRTIQQDLIDKYSTDIITLLKQFPELIVIDSGFASPGSGNPDDFVYLRPRGAVIYNEETGMYIGDKPEPILVVLDNLPMPKSFEIRSLSGRPIKRIEVLRPPYSTSIFGDAGYGGALLITTDDRGTPNQRSTSHLSSVMPLGYKQMVEFYSPKYQTSVQRDNAIQDVRTTIYWKPDVEVIHGSAYIEFYTADANTTYSVVLEGITTDGITIRQTRQIERN